MSRFSIEAFKAVLDESGGVARSNRFFVSLVPPSGLQGSNQTAAKIEYYCEAANLPGYQLQTSEARRWTYGTAEKRPFVGTSNPVQLMFIGDGKGELWNFFHSWINFVYNHDVQSGINPTGSSTPYELEYKKNYAVDMAIYHLPETYDGTEMKDFVARTVCFEAFPTAIIDMQLNWGDKNNLARFGVQFDYLDFVTTKLKSE